MRRVTGFGGLFFKSKDPEALAAWYTRHLGITVGPDGSATFTWEEDGQRDGMTVWAIFKDDSAYFDPTTAPFMMNFRVEDLDGLLAALRDEGVWIDAKREDYEYGRFAWIRDPEGRRIELWEPPR